MSETNESEIENVKADLASPVPDKPVTKPKEKTKVATKKKVAAPQKAAPKKLAKVAEKTKAVKEPKAPADENMVSLAQLAAEADISGQTARQKIRATDLERDGRWAWKVGSRDLQTARKALGLAAK